MLELGLGLERILCEWKREDVPSREDKLSKGMNLVGESEDWGAPHVTRMEDAWRQVKSREIRMDMRMHLYGETVQGLAEGAGIWSSVL